MKIVYFFWFYCPLAFIAIFSSMFNWYLSLLLCNRRHLRIRALILQRLSSCFLDSSIKIDQSNKIWVHQIFFENLNVYSVSANDACLWVLIISIDTVLCHQIRDLTSYPTCLPLFLLKKYYFKGPKKKKKKKKIQD